MEYAYVLVTPKGCEKNINIEILKDLIKIGKELGLTTLTQVYDITRKDIEKLYNLTQNEEYLIYLEKQSSNKIIMPLFIKGVDAINKVKKIVYKYNNFSKPELDKKNRYLDNIYMSNSKEEAILDFCQYFNIEDFSKIEEQLFPILNEEIVSFNFKGLEDFVKTKKLI